MRKDGQNANCLTNFDFYFLFYTFIQYALNLNFKLNKIVRRLC